MTRLFIMLPEFEKQWLKIGLNDNDLKRLQYQLLENPATVDVMRGTGGLRKLRFAFENRGKSGSVRVVYVDFMVYEKIFLITAYPKNEKENLSKEERNKVKKLVEVLEKKFERGIVMNVYESIVQGLNEAIEYEQGNIKAKSTTLSVAPVPDIKGNDVKDIRLSLEMTQIIFAEIMGVSVKTVEAWESGINTPSGVARRMLYLLKTDPSLLEKYNILSH